MAWIDNSLVIVLCCTEMVVITRKYNHGKKAYKFDYNPYNHGEYHQLLNGDIHQFSESTALFAGPYVPAALVCLKHNSFGSCGLIVIPWGR